MSKLEKLTVVAAKAADWWHEHLAKMPKVDRDRLLAREKRVDEMDIDKHLQDIEEDNKYAKGGKIENLKALLDHFRGGQPGSSNQMIERLLQDPSRGMHMENSEDYLKLLDDIGYRWPEHPDDYHHMLDYAETGLEGLSGEMEALARKYSVELPPGVNLHRGISLWDEDPSFIEEGWGPGRKVTLNPEGGPVATSLDRDQALNFVGVNSRDTDRNVLTNISGEKPLRIFPLPASGQDEILLMPGSARVRSIVEKESPVDNYLEADIDYTQRRGSRPRYADGGKVGDKKNRLKDLSDLATLPNPLMPTASAREKQLFLRGLLSQWYGLNNEGDPEFLGGEDLHNWPGIVDEVISMPTLLPDRFVPEASKSAAQRLEALNARMHQDMGIDPAEGFMENLYDAGGTMMGQIPTGGAKAVEGVAAKQAPGMLRRVGRFLKNAGEWFTPTVEASPKNYIIGAGTGAGLNTLAEEPEKAGVNVISKYAEGGNVADELGGMKRRYSDNGGSARAVQAIKSAISAIESGDHSSVASLLYPHRSNEVVAGVLKTLGLEEE